MALAEHGTLNGVGEGKRERESEGERASERGEEM